MAKAKNLSWDLEMINLTPEIVCDQTIKNIRAET